MNLSIMPKGMGEYHINHDSLTYAFSDDLNWGSHEQLFIKPSKEAKVFTGKLFSKTEWEDFVYYSLKDQNNRVLSAKTLIQVSPPQHIIKEARVWIVDQKVATSSYYRFHGNIDFEETVAEEGLLFAREMAKRYHVTDAYVMDICLTYEGWKIMEINCINSAGFYKGNVKQIVTTLEEFYT
ncbi:ATP-grasp domain-containing protein [Rapidithrix thailandica]|uniref:ATP-grasp domain-containing protein n=1 Tax=Rapidithrix thailandica TaxID=413964 RepID=A0AAW9SD94_9BACT